MLCVMTTMVSGNTLAEVAALIGDVARANILSALMDGRALTAGELAWHAGVSPQTTSGHLAKLKQAQVIAEERQGRHRYHRLASAEVAQAIEALMAIAAVGPPRHRPIGPRDAALRIARTCYDHLAGQLGVGLADALAAGGHVVIAEGAASLTECGSAFVGRTLGIDVSPANRAHGAVRRPLCRACLDWSERRPHLAGRLGAALYQRSLELGWIVPLKGSRALAITPEGRRRYAETFGIRCAGA
jgi:DNA-binding transcriptional ArsR family regulator